MIKPQTPPSRRFGSELVMGLAFIVGVAVFAITFEAFKIWGPQEHVRLEPPERRMAGGLEMPLLAEPGTAPALWRLEDQAGKVVVVNYFATWCGPCLEELPEFRALARQYAPRGVVFAAVGIDLDGEQQPGVSRETVLWQFAREHALPFVVLVPPANDLMLRMRPPVPQTFVFDRHGRRARLIVGGIGGQNLMATLEDLLAEE